MRNRRCSTPSGLGKRWVIDYPRVRSRCSFGNAQDRSRSLRHAQDKAGLGCATPLAPKASGTLTRMHSFAGMNAEGGMIPSSPTLGYPLGASREKGECNGGRATERRGEWASGRRGDAETGPFDSLRLAQDERWGKEATGRVGDGATGRRERKGEWATENAECGMRYEEQRPVGSQR